jgi:glycosyltransferase involved in cell wall biosynthesis
MKTTALISIIVPVYNVDKYLRKCVDSIISQTYKNLEIILVDDGSPDSSPMICDEYASKDKRVRAVHRENGGLSAARNTGIDISSGDYILFVDSDDYIDSNLVEYLLKNIINNDSDIATVSFKLFYDNAETKRKDAYLFQKTQVINMAPIDTLIDSLYEHSSTFHAWGKLYKRELFDNIRYPEGRLFEDTGTTYKLILKSKKISISTAKKYHYLTRQGSILHSGFSPKLMDSINFGQDILHITESGQCTMANMAAKTYIFMLAISMFDTLISDDNYKKYKSETDECLQIIRMQKWKVAFNNQASRRARVYAIAAIPGRHFLFLALQCKNFLKAKGVNL